LRCYSPFQAKVCLQTFLKTFGDTVREIKNKRYKYWRGEIIIKGFTATLNNSFVSNRHCTSAAENGSGLVSLTDAAS
jgi:hypothetical protein